MPASTALPMFLTGCEKEMQSYMEIWLKVNCFDLFKSRDFIYIKNY